MPRLTFCSQGQCSTSCPVLWPLCPVQIPPLHTAGAGDWAPIYNKIAVTLTKPLLWYRLSSCDSAKPHPVSQKKVQGQWSGLTYTKSWYKALFYVDILSLHWIFAYNQIWNLSQLAFKKLKIMFSCRTKFCIMHKAEMYHCTPVCDLNVHWFSKWASRKEIPSHLSLTGAMLHALKLKLPLRNLALWSFSMVAVSNSRAVSSSAPSVTEGVGNFNWTLVPKCMAWENKFCVLVVQLPLNQNLLTSLARLGLEVKQHHHLGLDFTSWWQKN